MWDTGGMSCGAYVGGHVGHRWDVMVDIVWMACGNYIGTVVMWEIFYSFICTSFTCGNMDGSLKVM